MVVWLRKWWWFFAAVWILLAFVAWHYESKCGVFFSPTCRPYYWEGARWALLLKWVSPYQTLLGGFAALAAGAFVLWSQKMVIDENRLTSTKKMRSDLKAALAMTRSECIHVSNHLDKDSLKTSLASLEHTRASLPLIASANPRLLHITMSVMHRLGTALAEKEKGAASSYSTTKLGWYSSIATAFAELLMQVIGRLDAGDELDVNYGSFDGEDLARYLEKRGQNPSILFELGAFFRWPTSVETFEVEPWLD